LNPEKNTEELLPSLQLMPVVIDVQQILFYHVNSLIDSDRC